jgi:hypothetical protein
MAPEFGKPIHQLPLVPANVLKKHRVHEPLDTRFRSAARLLQALWREDRDLPIGSYVNEDGKRHKLGSPIAEEAARGAGGLQQPVSKVMPCPPVRDRIFSLPCAGAAAPDSSRNL